MIEIMNLFDLGVPHCIKPILLNNCSSRTFTTNDMVSENTISDLLKIINTIILKIWACTNINVL